MTTSGSSGRKGLFVYDRAEWASIMAQFLRYNALAGIRPRLRALKLAVIVSPNGAHMSRRVAQNAVVGLQAHPRAAGDAAARRARRAPQRLRAAVAERVPVDRRAARRGAARRAGCGSRRTLISTASELLTPDRWRRASRTRSASRPTTSTRPPRGCGAPTATRTQGIHLFEDFTHVENVDADGHPVPDGEPGARLLVTSLFKRVQPLIRLEARGRRHAHLRALRVRAARSPDGGDRRPQRRHARARRRPRAPDAVRGSSPATATSSSSRSCSPARPCGCSSSPAPTASRSGCARASNDACASSASRTRTSRSSAAPRSRAPPRASCSSSSRRGATRSRVRLAPRAH